MLLIVFIMRIPARMPDLDEAHATFHQPSRQQQLPALFGVSIRKPRVSRFACDIKCIRGFHLHAECRLERLQSRLEQSFLRARGQMFTVHLGE